MVKNRVFHYLKPKAAGLVLFAVFGGAECRAFAAAPHEFLRAAQRQWRSEVTPADRRLIRKADTALACLKLTEDFSVKKLAVDISGAPYVIIDNSDPYDNSPVDSTYTASVQGAPDPLNMAYEWTISPNINNLSTLSGAPNRLPVDGAGPEGAGNTTCVAYSNGTNQSGSKQVTVQDEYVVTEKPGSTLVPEGTLIGVFGSDGNQTNATINWTGLAGVTKSGSTSDSTGFTAGLSVPILDLINVNFGLSLTSTNTVKYSYTFSQTFSLPIPPGDTVNVEGYVENDVYAGTYQVWGTIGRLDGYGSCSRRRRNNASRRR